MVVLGASFDTVAENKAFAEKFAFPYLLLSDPQRTLGVLYGAAEPGATSGSARRIAYLIDGDGTIQRVWPKAEVGAFAEQVIASL